MTERKTSSMLQRVPVILAVTAASYGLQLPPAFGRPAGTGAAGAVSVSGNQSAPLAPTPSPGADRQA
jgi:hypothetical protein